MQSKEVKYHPEGKKYGFQHGHICRSIKNMIRQEKKKNPASCIKIHISEFSRRQASVRCREIEYFPGQVLWVESGPERAEMLIINLNVGPCIKSSYL